MAKDRAKSSRTWGVRQPRTTDELGDLYKAFFATLVVPTKWRFIAWDLAKEADGTILSVGKVFRDDRTKGLDLKDYKVLFLTYSERGAICEKFFIDYGKSAYRCATSNLTIEKLNTFITDNYNELNTEPTPEIDENDGLQHFRDRFGAGVDGGGTEES